MELIVDEDKMKELLKESLTEMMKDKRSIFHKIVTESIEDIGMANAIKEGRKNKFVEESTIFEILQK